MIPKNEMDSVFFVICLDPIRKVIVVDYYNHSPMYVFRGTIASKIYSDILDMCGGLSVSHKKYLKKELKRAETCLMENKRYVQG